MKKVLNNLFNIIDKIGKHNFILIIFIFIVFLVAGLYSTFSLHTSYEGTEVVDGDTTYKFVLNDENDTNRVTVAANSTKRLGITVANDEKMELKYGIYYTSSDTLTNITVEYLGNVGSASSGVLYGNTKTTVIIKIKNESNNNVNIDFGILFGFESGGELVLGSNQYWIVEGDESIKVTFNYNGGTETINTKGVFLDNTYGELPNPVKDPITVQFNPQSGTITGSSSASKTFTFNGWYSDSALTNQVTASTIVTDPNPHTLYAKWTESSGVTTLPTATRAGYRLLGWYDAASGGTKIGDAGASYTITSETILYAQWEEAKSYAIVYNLNGGNNGASAPTEGIIDQAINISNPSSSKTLTITFDKNTTSIYGGPSLSATSASGTYSFAGWTSTNLNTSTAYTGASSSSVTTAWTGTSTTNQYFKNLASANGSVTLNANWSVTVKLATVTRTMYTCNWNTASDGSGTLYASGGTYTSTSGETALTLYAICTYGYS